MHRWATMLLLPDNLCGIDTHANDFTAYAHHDFLSSIHVKEFRGSADPLRGDEFNRRVREAAKVLVVSADFILRLQIKFH